MNKKRIKAFRLLAFTMAAVMVLSNSSMTVLAAWLDGYFDDTEEIVIYTQEDGDESDETVFADEDEAADGEESEEGETDESEEIDDSEDSHDNDILKAEETLSLSSDVTYSNAQLDQYSFIYLNEYKLTVTDDFVTGALVNLGTGELTVNGDMTASGVVFLDEGTLTVNGTYTQTAKDLVVKNSKAKMNVSKNLVFIQDGYIEMNSEGKINVNGNLVYNSRNQGLNNNAIWTVKGDIIQGDKTGFYRTGRLVLSGTGTQTIQLKSNSRIETLTVNNQKVIVDGYLNGPKLQNDFEPIMKGNFYTDRFYVNGHTLHISGGLEGFGQIDIGNGGKLIIDGDVNTSGRILLDNGTLTVGGTYTQTGGELMLWEGTAKVNITKDAVFTQNGNIVMLCPGTVDIGGSVSYGSQSPTMRNFATWTVQGNITQDADSDVLKFQELVLPNENSKVNIPNGLIDTLTLGYGKSHYTINPDNCYNKLIATSILTFDANGGSVKPQNKKITTEQTYGELPVPARSGYDFEGWYTQKNGGGKITASTTVSAVDDTTVYAHWKRIIKPVTSITLDKTNASLKVGEKTSITAKVLPNDATDKTVKWSTSNKNIATVDSKGNVTAVAKGTATITATAADGSGVKATCKVTVTTQQVTGITLNKTSLKLSVNKSETLTATVKPDNATDKTVKWSSSDSKVAKVDNTGKVTAVGAGTATITATAADGSGKKATCKVTVVKFVSKISLNKTNLLIHVGEAETLKATVSPSDASDKTVKWTSSDAKVVKVDNAGKVTAVGEGTATITATAADGSGKKATATVKVTKLVTDVFDDVKASDWFVNAVQYVYDHGIMAGTNGGKSFSPNGKLTREQFTQVLYAYEGKPAVTQTSGFSDVDSNAWYAKSVYWAKEKGIAGGKPDGTFGVGENISRQDLAVMLYTYAKIKNYDLAKNDNALDNFNDKGKVSGYAKDAMKWAVTQGIISGKGNGKVDPTGNATRAECATMIMKLIEKNK